MFPRVSRLSTVCSTGGGKHDAGVCLPTLATVLVVVAALAMLAVAPPVASDTDAGLPVWTGTYTVTEESTLNTSTSNSYRTMTWSKSMTLRLTGSAMPGSTPTRVRTVALAEEAHSTYSDETVTFGNFGFQQMYRCVKKQEHLLDTVVGPRPSSPPQPGLYVETELFEPGEPFGIGGSPLITGGGYRVTSSGVALTGTATLTQSGTEFICNQDSTSDQEFGWIESGSGGATPLPEDMRTFHGSRVDDETSDTEYTYRRDVTWNLERNGGVAAPPDVDGDGILDATDHCPGEAGSPPTGCPDSDADGRTDIQEGNFELVDTDHDGQPDYLDLDSDNDDLPDADESDGDLDADGIPDWRDSAVPCSGELAVVCYAPEVRLHEKEEHFPMGVDEFVARSSLRWAHNAGCLDEEVVPTGEIDAKRLSGQRAAPYTERQQRRFGFLLGECRDYGREYGSGELTRPSQKPWQKAAGMERDEGFFLDLDNVSRGGDVPIDTPEGRRIYTPLTYSYSPGNYITYWFMYGFNPGATIAVGVIDSHEGEWERITVRLNADNTPRAVDFYTHLCPPITRSWSEMTDGTLANGDVVEGSHPIVYSAKGAHASYPAVPVDRDDLRSCGPVQGRIQGRGDEVVEGGPKWQTWKVELRLDRESDWYGFGGAWGEVGKVGSNPFAGAINTGPLGPPCKDPEGLYPDACIRL